MRQTLAWILLGMLLTVDASSEAAGRPNIVLVMADDQGWGDVAYNGHPILKTPNLDAAAANGLRFDKFYAAAPVCSPTRASVLTGRHPNRMGVFKWGHPIRPQEVTIAEALQTTGYVTAHFGKWHLGSVRHNSPVHPGKNGFDEWLSSPNFFDNDPILSRGGQAIQTKGESSMVAVDAALEWIKANAGNDKPLFCVVWFGSPHKPHQAVEQDRRHYAEQPEELQNFYGEITGMDRAFGKLRAELEELAIRDNTVLWYCSNNGALPKVGSTGGHRGHKSKVYEGGLLVPAFIEWPSHLSKPRVTNTRCNTSDIYPTLLEITGATVPKQPPLDGVSLVPLIDGASGPRQRPMGFWNHAVTGIKTYAPSLMGELLKTQQAGGDLEPHESSLNAAALPEPKYPHDTFPCHAAWTDGDWKLHRIDKKNNRVKWEIYNLAKDPEEHHDLVSMQSRCVESLRPKLESWLNSVVDSLNGEDY